MTYTQYKKLGNALALKALAERSLNNLVTIRNIILECIDHGWNYRIGSNVFPLMTHPDVLYKIEHLYNADKIFGECKNIATIIRESGIRCSMHPDQFVVPASPKANVRESAIRELEQHGMIMDLFDLPKTPEAPINIHMNCYNNGNFSDAADRFVASYNLLSNSVRNRLALECEDKLKSWTVVNLYNNIYERTNIPITFDNLHNKCNPSTLLDEEEAFGMAVSTWPVGIIPLFHFSESLAGKNPRAHADFPTHIPEIYKSYKNPLHLDFEFKSKEAAIKKVIFE